MKNLLPAILFSALTLPAVSFAQGPMPLRVGTVDMNRAFKEYNKTKDAEGKINAAKDAAKKEYDDRRTLTRKRSMRSTNSISNLMLLR
jgi:hypothetical protein